MLLLWKAWVQTKSKTARSSVQICERPRCVCFTSNWKWEEPVLFRTAVDLRQCRKPSSLIIVVSPLVALMKDHGTVLRQRTHAAIAPVTSTVSSFCARDFANKYTFDT